MKIDEPRLRGALEYIWVTKKMEDKTTQEILELRKEIGYDMIILSMSEEER